MKFYFKALLLPVLVLLLSSAAGYFFWYKPSFNFPVSKKPAAVISNADAKKKLEKIKPRLGGIRQLLSSGKYSTSYCFLVDMSVASGKKRFFVYNLETDSIEQSGLVTHGSGTDRNGDAVNFSNESGSSCTSLGNYAIGNAYMGKFGLAYKLHGLDKRNSNAFNRFVVLHAHDCVPDKEIYPFTICLSLGCPTVSPGFLEVLKKYIEAESKPILLSIYH